MRVDKPKLPGLLDDVRGVPSRRQHKVNYNTTQSPNHNNRLPQPLNPQHTPPHSLPSLVVMRSSRRNDFARKCAGRHLDANEVFGEVAAELTCGVV